MDASDIANHLMDVEQAGAQRCDGCAALLQPGPLQALLLLLAAEHRAAAAALNDAVVRLGGAPQSGEADVVLRDPAGPGFPPRTADEDTLLDTCVAEAEGSVQRYERALEAPALPEWLQHQLARHLGVAQDQLERLQQVRSRHDDASLTR
jgi:hypothetical protein